MTEEVQYFNQNLWSYWDSNITENNIVMSAFTVKNEFGINPICLRIQIYNTHTKIKSSINLTHKNVFLFLSRFKPIFDNIQEYKKKMEEDKTIRPSFSIQSKQDLYFSFLIKSEYENPCFMLSIVDNDLVDSPKCYISYYDFLSLIKIMSNFRDEYLSLSNTLSMASYMSDISDNMKKINHKLTLYYSELKGQRSNTDNIVDYFHHDNTLDNEDEKNKVTEDTSDNKDEKNEIIKDDNTDVIIDEDNNEFQNELNNYIDENRDNMKIENMDEKELREKLINQINDENKKKTVTIDKASTEFFTTKIINGSSYNLELLINNLINKDNPFDEFCKLLMDKSGLTRDELLPGCSETDYNGLCFTTSRYLQHILYKHLKCNSPLPPTAIPTKYTPSTTVNNINRSILYDLLVYFLYYNQFNKKLIDRDNNTTNNKGIITFVIKVLLSPFIYSFIDSIESEKVITEEISNRYKKYKENGIFNKTEIKAKDIYSTSIDVSVGSIKTAIMKMYSRSMEILDKIEYTELWRILKDKLNIIHLNFEDIKNKKITTEQINVILKLEKLYGIKNSINSKDPEIVECMDVLNTIPEIAKRFNVKLVIKNNDNLKHFISEKSDNDQMKKYALTVCDKIKSNYFDLKDHNIDFSMFNTDILKAFSVWDINIYSELVEDPKLIFKLVKESNMSHKDTLSLLSNINDVSEEDYGNVAYM